ncbi:ABC transporter ATP-binding protein [Facklamia miroungae]|uniref:ABC-2 type transport system ATP-binding protein n=1 Tax=Facklamia miroungae TaxID=120956 RepID=A0A1G7SFA8_9LACT|nr:ABC transporter ATP-binding protein [Facklamia miroungae]NKZ29671.1 ABC transporter ATP-binding protein [Facklamia miroungae]SDG21736.1 ABC-2 type transport system ATP-binding protein [Facklamia miroungae]
MNLRVENLTSGYRNVPVIKDINFKIESGEIIGLVGLNGAGKSTLLKTILGLLPSQSGQVLFDGLSISEDHQKYASQIAYIPETPILYEELTLREHLEMTALGYQIPIEIIMQRAQPLLEMFRLDKNLDWFPTHFSKGMKQKVMIICALVTDAKLLIIDEPFLGLDPLAILQFTELLKSSASKGRSIIFTTHILSIAEELCDSYLLLQKGHLVAQGNLLDLQNTYGLKGASLSDVYMAMTKTGETNG